MRKSKKIAITLGLMIGMAVSSAVGSFAAEMASVGSINYADMLDGGFVEDNSSYRWWQANKDRLKNRTVSETMNDPNIPELDWSIFSISQRDHQFWFDIGKGNWTRSGTSGTVIQWTGNDSAVLTTNSGSKYELKVIDNNTLLIDKVKYIRNSEEGEVVPVLTPTPYRDAANLGNFMSGIKFSMADVVDCGAYYEIKNQKLDYFGNQNINNGTIFYTGSIYILKGAMCTPFWVYGKEYTFEEWLKLAPSRGNDMNYHDGWYETMVHNHNMTSEGYFFSIQGMLDG